MRREVDALLPLTASEINVPPKLMKVKTAPGHRAYQ